MMNSEKYPNHCSQCGAPLTSKWGDVYCESCGQIYSLSEKFDVKKEMIKQEKEETFDKNVENEEITQKAADQTIHHTKNQPKTKHATQQFITVIIIIIMIVGCLFCLLVVTLNNHSSTAQNNSNRESIDKELSLLEHIYNTEYDAVPYPSATYENLPISTAIVLESANANMLVFSLFVYNTSGRDIDTSSVSEHLEINSLVVSSDQNDKFICTLEKATWRNDILENNEVRHKGLFRCRGSLSPKSSLINIDFDMPNWGSSHFQIPINSNDEELNTRIGLWLHGKEHKIEIILLSEKPQLVWVKKSDLTISDDRGNTLILDGCRPPTSQNGEGAYLLTLANDDGILITTTAHFLYLAECYYDEPFPSEINTLRASFKTTSGKTFTSQAVINKSDGWIYFENQ